MPRFRMHNYSGQTSEQMAGRSRSMMVRPNYLSQCASEAFHADNRR
jgi:hypothetical protein